MASMGNDAARISESVQVAPSELSPTIPHNYRPEGVVLHANTDIPVASSVAHANSQYGAGGSAQSFIPNLGDRVAAGDLSVHGADGTLLTHTVTDGRVTVNVGGHGIPLHNLDANPLIPFASEIRDLTGAIRNVTDFGGYGYQGYRATNQGMELAR